MGTARNAELSIGDPPAKRRYRSKQERRQIVEQTLQPGASVAVIARRHDVNANQVFHWRKLYREGRLDAPGAVHVFVRPIPKPLALLRSAAETTVSLHAAGLPDALAPAAFERYFQLFYSRQPQLDAKGIVGLLEDRDTKFEFSFRKAADNFKLIDDAGQEAVIVPLHEVPGVGGSHQALAPLIQQLQSGATDRWLLRKLQRYTLNVHAHQFKALERDLAPLPGGGYLLTDVTRYDPRFGLLSGSHPLDAMSLVQ